MARRKGTNDSDVETLEAPPEGLPDTTGEEEVVVEPGDTLDIRALHHDGTVGLVLKEQA